MKKFLVFLCAVVMVLVLVGSAMATVMTSDLQDIWDAGGITIDLPGHDFDTFTSIADPFGGKIDFDHYMSHYTVGSTWSTWSDTYGDPTGLEILYSSSNTLRMDFTPGDVYAFGFELEPNPFDTISFTLGLDDGSVLTQDVYGSAGALAFGFTGGSVDWLSISGGSDFAIGRLTIATSAATSAPVPEPATILLLGSGLIGMAGYGRRHFSKKS